jgi:hypothetical protein
LSLLLAHFLRPPLHPLIHCAHPLVSCAPSCTSGTPSRTSQTSTLSHLSDLHPLIHRAHPLVHPAHLSHGSNPPSRASSACSHESDPRSSKSHADLSRCPPFAVGQSVDPCSGKSHADPSHCPPFADCESVDPHLSKSHADPCCRPPFAVCDVPNTMDAMREHPAHASKFARASTPCAIHICSSHVSIH